MRHINFLNVILKLILLCFFSTPLFGQNDSISVHQIGPSQIKIDSFTFIIDTIQVQGIKNGNTIVTKSLFMESNTILNTTFYLKDGKMNFVKVIEPRKGSEKIYRYCDFYFTNEKVVAQNCRSIRQIGEAIRTDGKDANIGYNENLTFDFLNNYVFLLFNRLQNYR